MKAGALRGRTLGELGDGSGFSALRGGMYSDLGPLDPCPATGAPVALTSVALPAHLTGARSPRQLPAVPQCPGTPIGPLNLPLSTPASLKPSSKLAARRALFRGLEV